MDSRQRSSLKQFLLLFVGLFAGLFIDVIAMVKGIFTPYAFADAAVLLILGFCCGFAVLFLRMRKELRSPEAANKTSGEPPTLSAVRIRLFQGLISLLIFCFFYANWISRGQPILPRLVGSAASLGMTWLFIKNLRQLQARSKDISTNPSQE